MSSRDTSTRSLVAFGDATDIRTWSNIPYFLSEAGKRAGFISDALDLLDPAYARHRLIWKLKTLASLRRTSPYQFSSESQRRMWDRIPPSLRDGELLSCCQAFPPVDLAAARGTTFSFYIDMTLKQLWPESTWSPLTRELIARETAGYHRATRVVTMARETAAFMVQNYQLDPAKVFVVRAGANLHESVVRRFEEDREVPPWRQGEPFTEASPAVLGMIAGDPVRKGLPALVAIAEELRRRGRPVRVCIIGNCPEDLRQHPLVDPAGFISKSDETRFLTKLSTFAFGCLLSYAEPLGIGTLEALRLGVPVLGTRVGGIPDCVPDDAGLLIELNAPAATAADALEPLLFDPVRYAQLCAAARGYRDVVTWDNTIRELMKIWTPAAS